MNKNQKKLLFISLAISLAAIFIVLILSFNEDTISALKACNPTFLLLALGLHIISLFFWSFRIKFMCRPLGHNVRTSHCFNLVCSNMFIAAVTPSSIGGEPVRIYELSKANVPGGEATAVITMERVLDGIILALGTIVCMVLLGTIFSTVQMPEGALIAAYIAAGVFAGLVILFLILAKHPVWGLAFMQKIAHFITRKKDEEKREQTVEKFEGYANKFYSALHIMANKGKRGIAWGFLFSVLYWANEFAIAFFILWGLGVEPTAELFLLSIIMQLLVTVICMIPLTPGAVGVAEVSLGLFYSLIVPAGVVGLFVLIYRFIFYYFNLIIGFAASMIIVRRETKNKDIE